MASTVSSALFGTNISDYWFPVSQGGDIAFLYGVMKAHIRAVPLPDLDRPPCAFEVSSRRGQQFNTLIYARIDPLTGAARDAVFMNREDARALHLRNRAFVPRSRVRRRVPRHMRSGASRTQSGTLVRPLISRQV